MPGSNSVRRALVVEDDGPIRRLLRAVFGHFGFEVQDADSAKAAISILGTTRFDLIVIEAGLKGMSGTDLLRHLRNHDNPITVLMLTNDDGSEILRWRQEGERLEYVWKPFTLDSMRAAVGRLTS